MKDIAATGSHVSSRRYSRNLSSGSPRKRMQINKSQEAHPFVLQQTHTYTHTHTLARGRECRDPNASYIE